MILRLRALEHLAKKAFKTSLNRATMARDLGKAIDEVQMSIPNFNPARCQPPMCNNNDGTCQMCDMAQSQQELADTLAAE
jgi:hypothetical protein